MNGTAGLYIVFVVLVATFFNLLFLMLTLRVVCTRLWWRGQRQEDSEDAQGPECPALQRVTPVVIVHPDSEVVFGLKLVEAPPLEQQSDGENKEGQPKPSVQGSARQLSFWVASVPQQSGAARPEA